MKDLISPANKSEIDLRKINCKDCEKVYVGKTEKYLETKKKEHF